VVDMELIKTVSLDENKHEKLRTLVFELDSAMCFLGNPVSILVDVEIELSHLFYEMESKDYRETINYSYDEHLRKIRLLSEIMRHSTKELADSYDKSSMLSETMFHEILGK
jgi:hypothetical protein